MTDDAMVCGLPPMPTQGDRFAALLPEWAPEAERDVAHDGFDFDWMLTDPYRCISVSVEPSGRIHYAALLHDDAVEDFIFGSANLDDGIPPEVLDALARMYPALSRAASCPPSETENEK